MQRNRRKHNPTTSFNWLNGVATGGAVVEVVEVEAAAVVAAEGSLVAVGAAAAPVRIPAVAVAVAVIVRIAAAGEVMPIALIVAAETG